MKKRIYGKCILSGEHSVLRGYPAIAFPVSVFYMDVEYKPSSLPLKIITQGTFKKDLDNSLKLILNSALKKVGKTEITGELILANELPFGAGIGGSSALCLALAYIFSFKKWIEEKEIKSFSLQLEHLFHAKSSGIDIHVCYENKPILYQNGKIQKVISPSFFPLLYLSDLGLRSSTSKNVEHVMKEFEKDLELNKKRDEKMARATQLTLEALESCDEKTGFKKLSQAFHLAESCFFEWNLISPEFQNTTQKIKKLGALALKPTGSGGGFALSLWDKQPPQKKKKWIPLDLKFS